MHFFNVIIFIDYSLFIKKEKRMFIEHSIQQYGKIITKCHNKLILIDIALYKSLGNS